MVVMQSVPSSVLDGYELASMSLEYRRECGQSAVVRSMTSLEPLGSDLKSTCSLKSNGASDGPLNGASSGALNGASHGTSNGASNGSLNGASHGSLNGASNGPLNGASHAAASSTKTSESVTTNASAGYLQFVHLLSMEDDGSEIVRGRTRWRPKNIPSPL